ncbi:hypothetical protein A2U01_0060482 [Trifolium medium]|uniref:Uncharacterized protein n=1 Tax=Trifolium medium TaxID=97028 RepID=A0A392RRI4_9FABA|nr:hypothetical protein [Trifolium medium]
MGGNPWFTVQKGKELRVQLTSSRSPFWNMRVAQADMARRPEENFKSECITVTYALRRAYSAAR